MRICRNDAIALMVDIQERLFPHIDQHERLEKNCGILIQGLQTLQIPVIVTEQYPKGLGNTIGSLSTLVKDSPPVEKISFSCCGTDAVMSRLKQSGRKLVILFGIEAHVCVLQTCLDLKDLEYQPVIVEDCIGSRKAGDKETAVRRMVQTGVVISSYESLLFELCRTAGAPEFKTISALVK